MPTPPRKRLRALLLVMAALALVCAGLLGALLAQLRPEPATPEIARVRGPTRTVRTVEAEADCAIAVEVDAIAPDAPPGPPLPDAPPGPPVPDATVTVETGMPQRQPWTTTRADAEGRVTVPVPCGFVTVRASAPGFVIGVDVVEVSPGAPTPVLLFLRTGVRVYGTVSDADGTPIAGAEVGALFGVTQTDADGAYTFWTRPQNLNTAGGPYLQQVEAKAFGYEQAFRPLPPGEPDDPAVGFQVDFVLTARHDVRVWCAGLPDDDCGNLLVQCTSPWVPAGDACEYDDATGETTCACPEGEVAVRGGGRAVLVGADEDEAWLDFRDTGRIVGRVLVHGAPPEACHVAGVRVPTALEDLPRGLIAARRTSCEPDGRFVLEGLVAGDWEVQVRVTSVMDDDGDLERTLVPRRVRDRSEVDVGDVTLPGGGVIEGTMVDGLTGGPAGGEPVLAWRHGEGEERTTFVPADSQRDDGTFRLQGLPAGTWTVAHILAPQDGVVVTVREGAVTGGVRLTTADATALDENGFALAEDDDGGLVVQDVTPESPADEAGLVPGDEVVGVLVAGFDVAGAMGGDGPDFARAVLGHWDGPGVTLVVRGEDGREEEVPLEW